MHWFYIILSHPLVYLPAFAFWVWMLVACARRDPERGLWIWIIAFVPLGALIYFFGRYISLAEFRVPASLKRWSRAREIDRLKIATRQIGNAWHFVQLGEALLETGRYEPALSAFKTALEKEPDNVQALWGSAQAQTKLEDHGAARETLARLLELDPQYKFGDVSLAYGRALHETGAHDASAEHLEKHLRRWRHPEALYLLAVIRAGQSDNGQAREHLEELLMDVNGSPKGIARRHAVWKSRAKRMLRKLPANVGD